jgi:hypothetical protein
MKYKLPLDESNTETIFAPFYDPEHSPWLNTQIESKDGTEIVRDTLWDSTKFSWMGKGGQAHFTLKVFTPFDTKEYDELVLCLLAPKSATIEIGLLINPHKPTCRWSSPWHGKGVRQEIVLPISELLSASQKLKGLLLPLEEYVGVVLRVTSDTTDLPLMSLSWLGLRNSKTYQLIRRLQQTNRPDWSPWILPDEAWGDVCFQRGLLFDTKMLAGVRNKLLDPSWQRHFAILEERAAGYLKRDPEADFGEYLPTHDARYIRESQHDRTCYHWEALVLAFVGLVKEDRAMIRHALRYLMCMVHTRYWKESGEHNISSSTWSHLCFQEEMTTTSVAILLDWLGYTLFPRTRSLIRKALLEKGMVPVTRELATRDTIHNMNQGAVFNRALILGGLMLESEWQHFSSQTVDTAYNKMSNILDSYVKADGGVHEGPAYLCQTMNATLWAMIAYGRARGSNWEEAVRQRFAHVSRYVAAMSAVHPGKLIPAGDCRVEWFGGDALPIMAALCPDSTFADILGNCLTGGWVHELTGTLAKSGGLIGMVYGPDIVRDSRSVVPEFDFLPESGKVMMTYGGGKLPSMHLWISSNAQGASHSHSDQGQFNLEVNAEPIFIDRGMVQYWYAEAHFLSRSWLHNVFTPVFKDGSFPNQKFPETSNLITVSEDSREVCVPGNGVWKDYMSEYERRFVLSGSTAFSIIDKFALHKKGRVAFHLHTTMEFQISGQLAVLERPGYRIEVEFPWAETVDCKQTLMDVCQRPIFHLCAISGLKSRGQISTKVVTSSRISSTQANSVGGA